MQNRNKDFVASSFRNKNQVASNSRKQTEVMSTGCKLYPNHSNSPNSFRKTAITEATVGSKASATKKLTALLKENSIGYA